jgi:hypothetical protein
MFARVAVLVARWLSLVSANTLASFRVVHAYVVIDNEDKRHSLAFTALRSSTRPKGRIRAE